MTEQSEALVELEHESVMASVALGKWLSAALDDPNVCEEMKADIRRWFSAGHLYVAEIQAREAAAKEQAERIVRAWEALPGGHHSPRIVERWLVDDMKPAIDELRAALAAWEKQP